MLARREFLYLSAMLGVSIAGPGFARAGDSPLIVGDLKDADVKIRPFLPFITQLPHEYDYETRVEGKIPAEMKGALYRNGPGIFERDGYRKRCLLDGDGLVRSYGFADGKVRFRNRFVRTSKYMEETRAGRFLSPTWTTLLPGGPMANLGGGHVKNQAGVSAIVRNGRLYAFDEFKPPYELDPVSLETVGESWLGLSKSSTVLSAHSIMDRKSGDWIFYGLDFGANTTLHLTILDSKDQLKWHRHYALPRFAYMHDFLSSENHILLNLHPVDITLGGLLLGRGSFASSLRWKPENGNIVLIFRKGSGEAPLMIHTEATWMWHSLNAYETADELVADFVGFKNPDHFIGNDPALFAVMEGRRGDYNSAGEIRRYIIDLKSGAIRLETLDGGSHEFPMMNPHLRCREHRFGYFLTRASYGPFFTSVVRMNMKTGKRDGYDFEDGIVCTEPMFVPVPGHRYDQLDREPGWILTETLHTGTKKSALAILRADNLSAGPIAFCHLEHHLPLGFHGWWEQS